MIYARSDYCCNKEFPNYIYPKESTITNDSFNDEVYYFAYKIFSTLSDCSSRSVRTKALMQALNTYSSI